MFVYITTKMIGSDFPYYNKVKTEVISESEGFSEATNLALDMLKNVSIDSLSTGIPTSMKIISKTTELGFEVFVEAECEIFELNRYGVSAHEL
ncbi:MAG: hypothetical protein M0R17_01145 [Candidatus Omnitrophica bacterium]|jgi:hypothetical protein|nr:hypothetical protein [Candidatus Omnitrophota bacterium]